MPAPAKPPSSEPKPEAPASLPAAAPKRKAKGAPAPKAVPAPAPKAQSAAGRKAATKPPAPPRVQAAATPVPAPDKAGKKAVKARPRPVLVRDSFTMPEADFALIDALKAKALGVRRAAKKSELLRAGLQVLSGLDAKSLVLALDRLETVKTGRPKKGH
jgi:hypothetical protein